MSAASHSQNESPTAARTYGRKYGDSWVSEYAARPRGEIYARTIVRLATRAAATGPSEGSRSQASLAIKAS